MKNLPCKSVGLLAAALLLAGSVAAHAGTVTGNVTMTGTIVSPPKSCTISGNPTLDYNGALKATGRTFFDAFTSVTVNCTIDTAYSLTTPIRYTPVTVGGKTASVQLLYHPLTSLNHIPITGMGTGSPQTIDLQGKLSSLDGTGLPRTTYGAVAGTVELRLSY